MHRAVPLLVILGSLGCRPPGASPEPERSTPLVHPLWNPQDPHYAAFEAPELPNDCVNDSACQVGGCGSQVCSAQAEVMTTCQALPVSLPPDATCGCLESRCQWYSPSGASPGVAAPPEGTPCEPQEPRCPEGLQCVTVPEGPGEVCRAAPPEPDVAPPPPAAPEAARKYDFVVSFTSPGDGTDHKAAERLATVVEATPKLEYVQGRWGKEGEHNECFGLAALSDTERKAFIQRAKAAVASSSKVNIETNAECLHRPYPR